MPIEESDSAICYLFDQLKLPAAALQELATLMTQHSAIEEAEMPEPLVADIITNYTATHFTVRGANTLGLALRFGRRRQRSRLETSSLKREETRP